MQYSYLALGDSYTIGESISYAENFPNQAVLFLKQKGFDFAVVKIVAKTGWTTDELTEAISKETFLREYDIVSLLIGVNNQYRGRSVIDYKTEFESLLKIALKFAGNKHGHVFVLSIPDWGVTPFAEGRDRKAIAAAINEYNDAAEKICRQYNVVFIDITTSQRGDNDKEGFVAGDGLHPSGKEYEKWAKSLCEEIKKQS